MEAPLFSTPPDRLSSPGGATPNAPTVSANRGQRSSTSSPVPPSETRKTRRHPRVCFLVVAVWSVLDTLLCLSGCGAVLTDLEGSFTSPNHPGSYPPNLLCMWVIQVPPPFIVQIHVLSLAVEGPSPCLFDWLEVQEQMELRSVVTRSVMTPSWRFRGYFQ